MKKKELVRFSPLSFFAILSPFATFASIINLINKSKMKKIVITLILCMVAIGAIKNLVSHKDEVSSLLLYNIEALAGGEISIYHCIGNGSVDCPITHTNVEYVFGGYSLE